MAGMPQVSARELIRFLKAQGFVEDRQSGSHLTLAHRGRKIPVTAPVQVCARLDVEARARSGVMSEKA
jgi:predicted RNA binding protein YcfA (HicA-like mRNA interferase family)